MSSQQQMYTDDSSQSSDASMTHRSTSRFSPAAATAAAGTSRSRQSKSRNLQKYAPSAIPSHRGGGGGGSMTTPAAATAAGRDRRKRVLFAGTMACAVGAATTLSNTFDFDLDFSFSTSPASGTAQKAGGLRAGSSSSANLQRRLELASAEYMSGGVGDAPEDIVNFLGKYGLEMKDLELMAQLKGVQVDETSSVSSTLSTAATTTTTTSLGDSSTLSTVEETSDVDDAGAALLSSLLAGSSEESLTTTEGGDETSTEDEAASSGGFLSSFLSSSSATTEEFPTTTEITIDETPSGSASPLDLSSLMSSMSAELSTTETETEAEAESQPEEALSLESLMASSTATTTEPAPVEEIASTVDAPPALNPEQQAMMMQMMASGSMPPEQQQQMMEMMLGQAAGGDAATATATSTDSSILPTSTDALVVSTPTADAASSMAFESTANAAPGFGVGGMANFKDSWEPWEPSDIPVFFHIPKAGGSSVKDNIGSCHRFTMATEFGVTDGHDQDTEIAVVYPVSGPPGSGDRSPFVNVDTTTVAGIQRAKEMGFADAGLADAVVTGFLYEANDLFTPTAKGRMFTVFRHPIERAISMFYYIQVADWEPTYSPELKDWTIEQYAESDRIENNWMTRQLSGQLSGDLDDNAVNVAIDVIRSKFLVGLMTEMDRTMERFEKFFQWKFKVNPENQEACRDRLMSGGSNSNSANKKEMPKEGDIAYEKLMWQNQYDMQLYDFIVELFEEQEAFVSGVPDGYRLIDATCCKCDPPTFPPEGYECPQAIQN